jgi:transketolase
MPLTDRECSALRQKAVELRKEMINVTGWAGGGHIGGSLSMTEMLTLLYFKYLQIDPNNPAWDQRDRFVLSKGHGGLGHAVVLGHRGYFDPELLREFNHFCSRFGMHLDANKVPGVDVSTGSMGHGLGQAVGLALGARVQGKAWRVYCIVGDGECHEGSIWEAAMAAAHFKLDNLIVFLDRNRFCIDGNTEDIMALEPIAEKWKAFGWQVREVDGHDLKQLAEAIEAAQAHHGSPSLILAKTVKGKGVDFMEDNPAWHYGALSSALIEQAKASVEKALPEGAKP